MFHSERTLLRGKLADPALLGPVELGRRWCLVDLLNATLDLFLVARKKKFIRDVDMAVGVT